MEEAPGIERFGALVRASPVPLGEAALVVASVLGHPAPVAQGLDRLADLAAEVPGPGPDLRTVTHHLFVTMDLRGDSSTYYAADNSLLPAVLDRRRGIPITLAILAVDVARRLGLDAVVVGMPGHVLVGDGDPPTAWCDVFNGGEWLDALGARARFASIHGRHAPFDPRFLAASPDHAVLARLLANLVGIYAAAGDGHQLVRVLLLRAQIPGVAAAERPQLASALASVGRFQEAAEVWQAEAGRSPGPHATAAGAHAARLRARLN